MSAPLTPPGPRRIGLVVHPTRNIDAPLRELMQWAEAHAAEVVQVRLDGRTRSVAPVAEPSSADLIVSVGGDGTMLAALRAGMACDRPVLGIACGSLGVLTRIAPGAAAGALQRFAAGDWRAGRLPALSVTVPGHGELLALNDIAIVRAGIGQIRIAAHVDEVMYGRIAGDGCIVSTPLGSSAYALAAGGPLLHVAALSYLLTPLPAHGGSLPPLVMADRSVLRLEIGHGFGGARLEIDGQLAATPATELSVTLHPEMATIVGFADDEPLLTVLRNRQVLSDSPRTAIETDRP